MATAKRKSLIEEQMRVGVRELRQEASKLLDKVKSGETIIVTEWGKPVAKLVPIAETSMQDLIDAGLIIPAKNPIPNFNRRLVKITGAKTATQVLLEMRAEQRY